MARFLFGLFALFLLAVDPAHATNWYISPCSGADTNNGTSSSTPVKTIAKFNTFSKVGGDNVYLDGSCGSPGSNDTVMGFYGPSSGFGAQNTDTSNGQTVTVQPYNTTNCVEYTLTTSCPYITPPAGSAGIRIDADHIRVQNLRIVGAASSNARGINILNNHTVGAQRVGPYIANNYITGFGHLIEINGNLCSSTVCDGWFGITLHNNTLVGTQGWEEEAVYMNGPGTTVCWTSTQGCPHKVLTISGNYIANIYGLNPPPPVDPASGTGISLALLDNSGGGGVYLNQLYNIGLKSAHCGGPVGIMTYRVRNTAIYNNFVSGVGPTTYTSGCDWLGIDIDNYSAGIDVRQNYVENTWGSCYEMYADTGSEWTGNMIRWNVGNNCAPSDAANFFGCLNMTATGAPASGITAIMAHNMCVTTKDASGSATASNSCDVIVQYDFGSGAKIEDNILYEKNQGCLIEFVNGWSGTIDYNNYWAPNHLAANVWAYGPNKTVVHSLAGLQTSDHQDAHSLATNPMAGASVTCGALPQYLASTNWPPCQMTNVAKLQSMSPMFEVGTGPIGTETGYDGFNANDVPNTGVGSHYNIGADNENPY